MKYPIMRKSMALMLMLKHGQAIDQNHAANTKDRDLNFVNPCTGEISRDEYDDDEPCVTKSPTSFPTTQAPTSSAAPTQRPSNAPTSSAAPTQKPSNAPTSSAAPTQRPSNAPTESKGPTNFPTPTSSAAPTQLPSNAPTESNKPTFPVEDPIPQCFRCDYDSTTNENIVEVLFKYGVEISSADGIETPDTYLPELEGKMLENLSSIVLSQCSAKVDVRKLDNNPTSQYSPDRRVLIAEKGVLSICSTPTDVHLPEETCDPENSNNKCFIIKGGVSVSIEDGDSAETIRDEVLEAIKKAMDDDDLLSEDTPEVEKVTFIGEIGDTDSGDDDGEGAPVIAGADDGSQGKKKINVILIAASFVALAALLAAFLIRRKRNRGRYDEGSVASINNWSSFVAPDSMNLAKEASAYNVHNCKSQTCTKCYRNNPLQFVPAPMNKQGKFAKDNINAVPSKVSSVGSDDSSVSTIEY